MYGKLGRGTLIKMANLYTQPNLTGGLDQNLVEVVSTVPSFIPGLLLFVFGVVFLAGSSTQRARAGFSDNQMWAVLASISTLLVSLLLTLIPGLINIETLGVVVAVNIFSGLWLFLSKARGEF